MKGLKLSPPLKKLSVYATKGLIIIYGYNEFTGLYHVLEISRPVLSTDGTLKVRQLPQTFTLAQVNNRKKHMQTAYKDIELLYDDVQCIYGCIKLLESYYLILVTKKVKVGSLLGHSIYTIEDTAMIPITYGMWNSADESRYKSILASFDLSKHIYFSYTYDLTKSWQLNATTSADALRRNDTSRIICQSMFVWNAFALKPLLNCATSESPMDAWCMPMVHGYIQQRNMRLANGISLRFLLIARRSRLFAGTRYLRRGVDALGSVANEVESEQIFISSTPSPGNVPRVTSVVQCRGSIPLFWSHTNLYAPKPDVQLEEDKQARQKAAQAHFENLFLRYGFNINVLNLVKQAESKGELMLGKTFRETCIDLNREFEEMQESYLREHCAEGGSTMSLLPPVNFIAYDFLNKAKAQHIAATESGPTSPDTPNVFRDLNRICEGIFPTIGFYVDPPPSNVASCTKPQDQEFLKFPIFAMKKSANRIGIDIQDVDELLVSDMGESNVILSTQSGPGVGTGSPIGLYQNGVMRTNCMDCLDRTNVAQFCFARVAIPRQLRALGLNLTPSGVQEVISVCMEVWAEHGDTIATQYGGSGAMHKVDEQATESTGEKEFVLTGGAKNAIVAVQRYYSNISTDFERQQSMDLLLGIFEPRKNEPAVWDQKLRTQHMRVGTLGRRASDMAEAVLKNQLLASELRNLMTEHESSGRVESATGEESCDADTSAEDELNTDLQKRVEKITVGFGVAGLAGSFYHESSAILDITVFEDVVEEFDVDNLNMEQIVVYPFPPLTTTESIWMRHTQSRSHDEPETDTQCAVARHSYPPGSLEHLYSEYIEGSYMFSTIPSPVPAAKLHAHKSAAPEGEVSQSTSHDRSMNNVLSSSVQRPSTGEGRESDTRSTRRTSPAITEYERLSDDAAERTSTVTSVAENGIISDSSRLSTSPPESHDPTPVASTVKSKEEEPKRTGSFMWPFRKMSKRSVPSEESGVDGRRTSVTTTVTSSPSTAKPRSADLFDRVQETPKDKGLTGAISTNDTESVSAFPNSAIKRYIDNAAEEAVAQAIGRTTPKAEHENTRLKLDAIMSKLDCIMDTKGT
mmetsp:Transcript_3250/g.5057  ORF Transcript_3250/g.5057 Transcript_3250/m.5057 type:complete len:1088 (-) Transcript_3250:150-3413(-)|eukprot:CAMPEP_0185028468 /NCGR_PEP_ID=MMETSP1103-20130426/14197_1 /TAXON_ID=36769 /ORGANISM="Paraphysomonas bandaiensis, Strain Caron Lab Isolate" /LENGTH=1087 /DNA_ID=CAMNT_0027562893 /DNA_START=31 /DNA_END=3294 /DNA_ORIENTATION=+